MEEWLKESQIIFNQQYELEQNVSNSEFETKVLNKIKEKAELLVNESFIALGMLNSFLQEANRYKKGDISFLNDWLKI